MHTAKQSAGILLYRNINNHLEVFLVHPGGPFFKNKDNGAWSIPKGELLDNEDLLTAAKREFFEETGQQAANGNFIKLTPVKLKSGKVISAWAVEGHIDPENIVSNLFEIEWPPKSGKMACFAEADRADWFEPAIAKIKINPAQAALIDELELIISM